MRERGRPAGAAEPVVEDDLRDLDPEARDVIAHRSTVGGEADTFCPLPARTAHRPTRRRPAPELDPTFPDAHLSADGPPATVSPDHVA
jgi:hypothetical protein